MNSRGTWMSSCRFSRSLILYRRNFVKAQTMLRKRAKLSWQSYLVIVVVFESFTELPLNTPENLSFLAEGPGSGGQVGYWPEQMLWPNDGVLNRHQIWFFSKCYETCLFVRCSTKMILPLHGDLFDSWAMIKGWLDKLGKPALPARSCQWLRIYMRMFSN